MNLGFKTHFKGKPTHFVEKVMCSLIETHPGANHLSGEASLVDFVLTAKRKGLFKPGWASSTTSKIHTIREDTKNKWKAGRDIHFAIGVRTRDYWQFAPVVKCKSIQHIKICRIFQTVVIDDRALKWDEISELAKNDGFDSVGEFWNWFDRDFTGKIIHWTNHRYE